MFLISLRLRRQTLRQLFFFFFLHFCRNSDQVLTSPYKESLTFLANKKILHSEKSSLWGQICFLFFQWLSIFSVLFAHTCSNPDHYSSVSFIFPAWVINTKSPFHVIILIDKNCYSRGINFKTLTWEARETRLVKQCSSHDPTTSIAVYQVTGSWVGFSLKNKKQQSPTLSERKHKYWVQSLELHTC